jgi:hypothetical protein
VLAIVRGSELMHQGPSQSQSLSAQEICEVTVLVPKDCAERIRQFAEKLRARHQVEPTPMRLEWRALSPSAELMVSQNIARVAPSATPRHPVRTDFFGPSRYWDS